jgi:alkanesulfonate monooxygenase SsuD/methylene tetrahydromethanopterin reductase-like flavin-dependent oxidoreductase (luciferase family)
VKIGVTLPTFTTEARRVLDAARAAEDAGLHGVFSFDHQFPIGHPERPSLSIYPVLGAVGAVTSWIRVGSLVARIGLLPDEVVVASLESLSAIVGERVVAGLGTGDEQSVAEHLAYGLPYFGFTNRVERLVGAAQRLRAAGIECWVGAGGHVTIETAEATGATLNMWGATPERVAKAAAHGAVPVSWGGPMPSDLDQATALLASLAEAGATWAVWPWPSSLGDVARATSTAGIELGDRSPVTPRTRLFDEVERPEGTL